MLARTPMDKDLNALVAAGVSSNGLNLRDQVAIAVLAEGGTMEQAAKASKQRPSAIAHKMREPKSALRMAFLNICEQAGLTDQAIAVAVADALTAHVVVVNRRNGTATESDVPDHIVRLRAADMAAQLKGHYPDKDTDKALVTVNIVSPLFSQQAPASTEGAFVVEALPSTTQE